MCPQALNYQLQQHYLHSHSIPPSRTLLNTSRSIHLNKNKTTKMPVLTTDHNTHISARNGLPTTSFLHLASRHSRTTKKDPPPQITAPTYTTSVSSRLRHNWTHTNHNKLPHKLREVCLRLFPQAPLHTRLYGFNIHQTGPRAILERQQTSPRKNHITSGRKRRVRRYS